MNDSYIANKPLIAAESFDDEIVIVHLENGNYYSLAGSGTLIWSLLELGTTVDSLVSWMTAATNADRETIARAVKSIVEELAAADLIKQAMSVAADPPLELPTAPLKFVAPILSAYTDMQDMLALDPVHDVSESGWPNADQSKKEL